MRGRRNDRAAIGDRRPRLRLMGLIRLFTVPNLGAHPPLLPSDFPSSFSATLRHIRLVGSRSTTGTSPFLVRLVL